MMGQCVFSQSAVGTKLGGVCCPSDGPCQAGETRWCSKFDIEVQIPEPQEE